MMNQRFLDEQLQQQGGGAVCDSAAMEGLERCSSMAPTSLTTTAPGSSPPREKGMRSHGFELQEHPSFWKDNNVQVVIRIRPLSSSEMSLQGQNRCVKQENCQTVSWVGHPESRFTFDQVADEYVSQERLFKVVGVPMVENCMAGYNSCMFAYGQTGSGKTHTMLGDIEGGTRRHSVNCGMTPRVFEYLFSRIQKEKEIRSDEKIRFSCKCSFLEIYNEQILDLLDPSSSNLQIREDAKRGIHVENITEFEVSSARDVLQQLLKGATNRKVASTNMNRASSRSHSVFTCVIECKWESQGITHHRFAQLNLVDLAGSERQKSSGAEGERLKEATNINKSLSTLGLVIMNLTHSIKKTLHVPYRDSKLTFLLQDSLGGNSKTVIIANISPSNCCSMETLSTLKFAQRAKFIRNNAIVNEDASGDVLAMRLQIQQLKKEVKQLRGMVNGGFENHENDGTTSSIAGSSPTFRWGGQQELFSPLTIDKRLSQHKEYEAALVAALRRDSEKQLEIKALAAEKQAAELLAVQRTDEIQGLKMRLRFREEAIKRLEAVASKNISVENFILQEKEEFRKEIELLRNQADRNPELTRFAMENLVLKEEIRRLKLFVEEGERERMDEQITVLQDKLLEALDWKLMHDRPQGIQESLSSSWDSSHGSEDMEFLRLQDIQNQREIEGLRKKLNLCLESKEKLERHVDDLLAQVEQQSRAVCAPSEQTPESSEIGSLVSSSIGGLLNCSDQAELKAMVDAIAAASQREAEAHETAIMLAKENEELNRKLEALAEDNTSIIHLGSEGAIEGRTNELALEAAALLRAQSPAENDRRISSSIGDICGPENCFQDIDGLQNFELQIHELQEENEKLMGLYENAMHERDEFKRMVSEKDSDDAEEREVAQVRLRLGVARLKEADGKLEAAEAAVETFALPKSTESSSLHKILNQIECVDLVAQEKQHGIPELKSELSELQRRGAVAKSRLRAAMSATECLSANSHYWSARESQAVTRARAIMGVLQKRKEEQRRLEVQKEEVGAACLKSRRSEQELRGRVERQKLMLKDLEVRRKEKERVLFAMDNPDDMEATLQNATHLGKASELLRSEEERTKLSSELKEQSDQLGAMAKEVSGFEKASVGLDSEIRGVAEEIVRGEAELHEAELRLREVASEKQAISAAREEGMAAMGDALVEYQQCVFFSELKEAEIRQCEEALVTVRACAEELRREQKLAARGVAWVLSDISSAAAKIHGDIRVARRSLAEARTSMVSEGGMEVF